MPSDRARFFDRLPIRTRLTLWYLLLSGTALLAFGWYQYDRLQRSLLASVDSSLEIATSQAVANIDSENGVPAFQNTDAFASLANRFGPDGFGVSILAPDGALLDSFGNAQLRTITAVPQAGFTYVPVSGSRWRVYTQPITSPAGEMAGWLNSARSLSDVDRTLAGLRAQLLLGLPLVLILLAGGGILLANRALSPVAHIVHTAQRLGARDLTQRIEYHGPNDEIGQLATTIDAMLGRLEQAFRRERRFTGDAAHELRTPLTALKGQIQVTLSQPRTPDTYRRTLGRMATQVERLIRMSDGLLFLSRSDHKQIAPDTSAVNLSELIEISAEQIRPMADAKHLTLETRIRPALSIIGDRDLLIRLLFNLVANAADHSPVGETVALSLEREGGLAVIRVADKGPGILPAHVPHIFERFYRADIDRSSEAGGAGLGLAIAQEITHLHEGVISVDTQPGQGATFSVRLPLQPGK
jgi:heavy metal sensor kinase